MGEGGCRSGLDAGQQSDVARPCLCTAAVLNADARRIRARAGVVVTAKV